MRDILCTGSEKIPNCVRPCDGVNLMRKLVLILLIALLSTGCVEIRNRVEIWWCDGTTPCWDTGHRIAACLFEGWGCTVGVGIMAGSR